MIAGLSVLADMPKFGECYIINATFIGSEETSSDWSVQFFSAFHWSPSFGKGRLTPVSDYPLSRLRNHMRFHWSPSIGKPRMTPVSFAKPTES